MAEKSASRREVVERVALTDDQRKVLSKFAERNVESLLVVRLAADELRRLAPGLLTATAIEMCW